MRLCDDCIQKIKESLNAEVAEILQKKIFPLLEKRENVSGRELAQAIDLDRTGVKQVIEELKNHLLLEYFYRGRKRIYKLTETAKRYREIEENPELISSSEDKRKEEETELKQEKDNQAEEEVEPQESQGKKETDPTSEKEADTEAETKQAEEKQEKDNETTADTAKPEEANKQVTTIEKKKATEESDQQDEDLVWNMKL